MFNLYFFLFYKNRTNGCSWCMGANCFLVSETGNGLQMWVLKKPRREFLTSWRGFFGFELQVLFLQVVQYLLQVFRQDQQYQSNGIADQETVNSIS